MSCQQPNSVHERVMAMARAGKSPKQIREMMRTSSYAAVSQAISRARCQALFSRRPPMHPSSGLTEHLS